MSAIPSTAVSVIRPMQESDVQAVMDIELRAYPFPWTAGIFADCLRVGYGCWVYVIDQQVSGYAVMSFGAGEAHLLNVCVAPELQGGGIGRSLMRHVLRQAERLGAVQLFLEVRPSNTPALALYRDLGFVQIGSRRGYYPAPQGREDALVLARQLSVPPHGA